MKELHQQLDKIIENIDKLKKEGQEFYDSYNKSLDNNHQFLSGKNAENNEKKSKKDDDLK